ncbi:DUF488 domain-containing protein [Pelagibacterium mangrovi]|uniref:DUF488 domain-containing protein n=1 Tax=Pelagibacterium mangrovi TaxID=3119828 RepID=UPI002FC77146
MSAIEVATIGFTKSSARSFFERLAGAGVKNVIDVRLHNTSQLAGFAKSDDLAYFLKAIDGIGYRYEPLLAPTEPIMAGFRKKDDDWPLYRDQFMGLMAERKIENALAPDQLEGACLLCSEHEPHHCHRSLVIEYLNGRWGEKLVARHL